MVIDIVRLRPPLKVLELSNTDFDSQSGERLLKALTHSNIVPLQSIHFENQASWFDSDLKCTDWAELFSKLQVLSELKIHKCGLSLPQAARRKDIITNSTSQLGGPVPDIQQ